MENPSYESGILSATLTPQWNASTNANQLTVYTPDASKGLFAGGVYEIRLLVGGQQMQLLEYTAPAGDEIPGGDMEGDLSCFTIDNTAAAMWGSGNNTLKRSLCTAATCPGMEGSQRTEFLEKSVAQTERLRRLLADVSTITRMDEASQLIRKEPVVLNDLIAEVADEMALKPAEQRLRVNVDVPKRVEVVGNPALLASIFRNLADNAAAYSGGRDIYIRLLDDTPEECSLLFADNGIGVGEEHLPHLFERFYRVDKGRSRKLGGTGLGLSIVKNAVMIHGGTITARNRERGGLEFRFTLRKKG